MNYNHPTLRRALAAEYATNSMLPRVRRRFEQLLQNDRRLRAEVYDWQSVLAGLTQDITPIAPPDSVWHEIGRRLNFNPAPRKKYIWQWLAACALMLALCVVLWPQLSTPTYEARLNDGANIAALRIVSAGNVLTIENLALPIPAAHQSLELWVVPKAGAAISLGLIPTSGRGQLPLTPEQQREIGQKALLAITLEPLGGSPTGVATGPIVYKGYLN